MLVGLSVLLIGCASNKIILHPITDKDFCIKGQANCDMSKMDYGMSEYFLNEVLQTKIDRIQ